MLRGNSPKEWARRCREHAALHQGSRIADMLLLLADQCDALAERLAKSAPKEPEPAEPDAP